MLQMKLMLTCFERLEPLFRIIVKGYHKSESINLNIGSCKVKGQITGLII